MNNLVCEVQPVRALAQEALGAKARTGCTSRVGKRASRWEMVIESFKIASQASSNQVAEAKRSGAPKRLVDLTVAFGLAPAR